jgi:hypothetical protein
MNQKTGCLLLCAVGVFFGASFSWAAPDPALKGKKVLHIDSYHDGYKWSEDIAKGIAKVFNGTGVELKRFTMDTKRHGKEEEKKEAGKKARDMIESFKPDLVITSDDNAVKYVQVEYYKDSKIPFIFCGVNWDASKYGLPNKTSTGMIEVDYFQEVYDNLRRFAKGDKIGYIGGDNETDRTTSQMMKDKFLHEKLAKIYLVKNYEDFKVQYKKAQTEVDMLYFNNTGAILGWNNEDGGKFVLKEGKIPSGSNSLDPPPFVLMTLGKYGGEQGEWAAKAGLKVLKGTPVEKIPSETNKRLLFIINTELANKLKVVFPVSILKVGIRVTTESYKDMSKWQ